MIVVIHENPEILKLWFQRRIELIKEASKSYYLNLYDTPVILLRVKFLVRLEKSIEEFLGSTARQIMFSLGVFRGKENVEKLIETIGKEDFASLSLVEKLKHALNMSFLNGVGSFTLEILEDGTQLRLKTNNDNEAICTDGRIVSYVLGYVTGLISRVIEKELKVREIRKINNFIVIDYDIMENTS